MTTLEMIELIVIAVAAVGLGIYYLIKAIRNNWVKELTATVEAAIKTAEESGKSGQEKKDMVLEAVRLKCIELGIPFDLIKKLISKLVDKIISNYNVIEKGK